MNQVEIVEVGPRDGLQNIPIFVPTETKVRLIRALARAGFRRMEVGSFVSPTAVPQMRDMAQVAQEVGTLAGVRAMVLVPNAKGFRSALAAGFREIEVVISMSNAHNRSNVRCLTLESISDLRTMLAELDHDPVVLGGRLRTGSCGSGIRFAPIWGPPRRSDSFLGAAMARPLRIRARPRRVMSLLQAVPLFQAVATSASMTSDSGVLPFTGDRSRSLDFVQEITREERTASSL